MKWFVRLDLGAIFPENIFYSWLVIEPCDAAEL